MDPDQRDVPCLDDEELLDLAKAQHRLLVALLAARQAHYQAWGLVASKKAEVEV